MVMSVENFNIEDYKKIEVTITEENVNEEKQ